MKTSSNSKYVEYIFLTILALIFVSIIFLADFYIEKSVAISVLYTAVVVYSWLLPGKRTAIYFGFICSLLTIIPELFSDQISKSDDISLINNFIGLVSIWISVILVMLAKRAFESFEDSLSRIEKKNIELKLAKDRESKNALQLYSKNKALAQFAQVASHDLQEPLVTLKQTANLLTKRIEVTDDNLSKKYFGYLNQSATKMQMLIKGLLDYSRLGANWKPQKINVELLIKELKEELIDSIENIEVSLEIKSKLPQVLANKKELKTVFEILLDNAIKFRTEKEPVNIKIDASLIEDYWEFRVSDNGLGIPKRFHSKIFVIYRKIERKGNLGSIGMGLSLAKKIIELHNGEIWVESEEGKGSTFFFTLPLRQLS